MHNETIRLFYLEHPSIMMVAIIASIVCLISAICCTQKSTPMLILYSLFTFFESIAIAGICALYYEAGLGDIVLQVRVVALWVRILRYALL